MDQGLPPQKIYPEPATRSTYDAQGRLAGYYYCYEDVPQFAEQEEELPTGVRNGRFRKASIEGIPIRTSQQRYSPPRRWVSKV